MAKRTKPGPTEKTPDVAAIKRRAMNPLLAALEAKGVVSKESAAAARAEHGALPTLPGAAPTPDAFDARVRAALASGAASVVARVTEEDLVRLEVATALRVPASVRRFLLTHGALSFRTEPASSILAPTEIVSETARFWPAHRDVRALAPLAATFDRALAFARVRDDEATALLACDGAHAGLVFSVAHDADGTPTGEPFEAFIGALLDVVADST